MSFAVSFDKNRPPVKSIPLTIPPLLELVWNSFGRYWTNNYITYCIYLLLFLTLRAAWTTINILLAEREGFEPSVRLHVQRFSRPPHSTTLPPLRDGEFYQFKNNEASVMRTYVCLPRQLLRQTIQKLMIQSAFILLDSAFSTRWRLCENLYFRFLRS